MSDELTIELALPDELVERLAARTAELVHARTHAQAEDGEQSPWLTVKEAAAYLSCSRHAIYRLTAAGAIPFRKRVGGQGLLFRRDELDAWIEASYSREGVVV